MSAVYSCFGSSAFGNQGVMPNVTSNRTTDDLVSPVELSDLKEYIGLSADDTSQDGLLANLLLSATQACIKYTNCELLEREWTLRADRYPERTQGFVGVGIIASLQNWWIDIPLYPVVSVDTVTIDETAQTVTTDYTTDLNSKPCRIKDLQGSETLIVTYTAGYATAANIPQCLLDGIMAYANYLYERRGSCEMGDALKESGAMNFWRQERMLIGGL